ncbi:MAG: cheR-type MCP methyltransferase [Osedax symbiont Rs2]|nr:MAG: cheR-type MCP methyltransferase [Osedax symbiont Rs2]
MKTDALELIEIKLLLEAIFLRYGYDFRHYAQASLERRIRLRVEKSNLSSISQMLPKVLHDPNFFNLFLKDISITVTEMFRDAYVFAKIRKSIFNLLRTYPYINIWHAGCATGEEVYSMAIMLKEEGLLERCKIYATDFNNQSLATAESGFFYANKKNLYFQQYLAAGGNASFADYYDLHHGNAKIKDQRSA